MPAPPPPPADNAVLERKLDRYLTRLTNNQEFSGAALVARGDNVLLKKAYGQADIPANKPNTVETRFQLASVAKTLTAAAVMRLVEGGRVDLQAPISDYLPDTPQAWQGVTVHHLLSHTSGIPDYFSFDEFDSETNFSADEIIRVAKEYPLDFSPGAEFEYSNTGYVLLGKLLERVSGKSYGEFLRETIFDPLQMNATGRVGQNEPVAVGYSTYASPAESLPITNALGDGDLLGTVEDLHKFDRALYGDTLLSIESRDKMFAPVGNNHYGYGWELQTREGRRVLSHSGRINGFSSVLMRFPEDEVTIILLSNLESFDAGQAGWELAEIVLE
jgi:CubicO group peptidase (beta-lactamase class C family)